MIVVAKLGSLPKAADNSFNVSNAELAVAVNALISPLTYAVVAICVVFVPTAAVGARGIPVKLGLAKVANPVMLGTVGLFKITPIPDTAFQSGCTCAAGIVGWPVKSV